jgi:hypothetical protein
MMHTLVGREGFRARHGPVLRAPRRPGRDLRRLRPGHRRRQPGQRAGQPPGRLQALVRQAGTPRCRRAAATTPSRPHLHADAEPERRATPGQPRSRRCLIPVRMGLVAADGPRLPLQLEGDAQATGTDTRAGADRAEQTFTFVNVAGRAGALAAARLLGAGALDDGLATPRCWCCCSHDNRPLQPLGGRPAPGAGPPAGALRGRCGLRRWTRPTWARCAACCATRRWTPPSRNWC